VSPATFFRHLRKLELTGTNGANPAAGEAG
jgi:hypothetical protein